MAWAEGSLWVGEHRARKIHQIDPNTGKILRTLESNRFVTGVTWIGDELWHATWEGEVSELRSVDAKSGEVLESVEHPRASIFPGASTARTQQLAMLMFMRLPSLNPVCSCC